MPVISVDGRTVGNGKPGATTKRLLDAFRKRRSQDGIPVPFAVTPSEEGNVLFFDKAPRIPLCRKREQLPHRNSAATGVSLFCRPQTMFDRQNISV